MNPYSINSEDIVNQITLNCLISKSHLMKINNSKIKKNLEIERHKNIKKNYNELLKLFENLVNNEYPDNLFDDVKNSYIHFIDKSLLYLNAIKNENENNNQNNQNNKVKENKSNKIIIDKLDDCSEKINYMIEKCFDVNHHLIENDENDNENNNENNDDGDNDGDENNIFYEDENDEDYEY